MVKGGDEHALEREGIYNYKVREGVPNTRLITYRSSKED